MSAVSPEEDQQVRDFVAAGLLRRCAISLVAGQIYQAAKDLEGWMNIRPTLRGLNSAESREFWDLEDRIDKGFELEGDRVRFSYLEGKVKSI